MQRGSIYNPKRRLAPFPLPPILAVRVAGLASGLRYGGNPEHKRNLGDFDLTPPAAARRGKSLCDDIAVFRRKEALRLLAHGFHCGLVDGRWTGEGWPELVWSVSPEGCPLEAQREGEGVYHGYPIPEADPFRVMILQRWAEIRG